MSADEASAAPAATKSQKCPEQRCTAALTTKSNLNRHMRKHGRKVRMPCGKELKDHPTNNTRHQKSCDKCQSVHAAGVRGSVVAGAGTNTHPHPVGNPPDDSAIPTQHILHHAPESHTAPEYIISANPELQYLFVIDPTPQVYEPSQAYWPTDPGAWAGDGDEVPDLDNSLLQFGFSDSVGGTYTGQNEEGRHGVYAL
ncbi:uncharacterized protein LY79DRAFT_657883 [Colletotrichum navitas]|uniref:C2H2-type domain-containing protein n=1 Tax=Colletotrichum navitas TaxID=681940 RepID=A0AAD8V7K4_9PEZI|nr:uncharacterized protein LY79DRAFT_657883 [Colletotrichum navitas]KAK1595338.1 hypothetical protein LY79DRAFT_657883 [Colletotrichum navitas]